VTKWKFDEEHPECAEGLSESYVWKWENTIKQTGLSLDTYYDAVQKHKELTNDKENGRDDVQFYNYLSTLNITDTQRASLYGAFGRSSYTYYNADKGYAGDYEKYAKPANIDMETFADFYVKANAFSGDKDKKTGKTINGSKQAKVVKYINSLNLTSAQKDALFLSMNYSKNSKAWKNRPWK
jgi:hypothetical protein